MLRVIPLFLISICFAYGSLTVAGEGQEDIATTSSTEGTVAGHVDQTTPENIFWDFITCVHSQHECEDEANHHHFPHWKTVHDHSVCHGHTHLACYGGHH